jgi:hypothetical protein
MYYFSPWLETPIADYSFRLKLFCIRNFSQNENTLGREIYQAVVE